MLWITDTWSALNFQMNDRHFAAYKVESTGTLAGAKAKLMALSSFYKMISIYDTWEQNKRIEQFNRTYGMIAEKTRLQSIKYSTELIFQSIVWHYSMQLQKREEERRKLDIAVAAPLPEVKLHSGWLTKKKLKSH